MKKITIIIFLSVFLASCGMIAPPQVAEADSEIPASEIGLENPYINTSIIYEEGIAAPELFENEEDLPSNGGSDIIYVETSEEEAQRNDERIANDPEAGGGYLLDDLFVVTRITEQVVVKYHPDTDEEIVKSALNAFSGNDYEILFNGQKIYQIEWGVLVDMESYRFTLHNEGGTYVFYIE
jgi:hypothetical protein